MVDLDAFKPVKPASRREQITAFLRTQIVSGAWATGTRLPPTSELTQRWQVPIATLQAAFAPLVREGLLQRRPGAGTVVCAAPARPARIGVYLPAKDGSGRRFAEQLASRIDALLAGAGRLAVLCMDHRPPLARTEAPPDLLHACRERSVDAVIACECDQRIEAWLRCLPVPTAAYGTSPHPTSVAYDLADFGVRSAKRLVAMGCRRIGLVTVIRRRGPGQTARGQEMIDAFALEAQRCGAATGPAYIRYPGSGEVVDEDQAEAWGYASMRSLLVQEAPPDGIAVYTDRAASGAVMGLLSLGASVAAPRLVLHRNAELGLFCPLPAEYLESSVAVAASRLVEMVDAQHAAHALPHGDLQFAAAQT